MCRIQRGMNVRTYLIAGAAAVAVAVTCAAQAAVPAAQPALARSSVPALMQSMFAMADSNRDQRVTLAEAAAAQQAYYQGRTARKQAYAMRHDPNALWAAMDTNRDGSLTRAEFDAHHAQLVSLHGAHQARAASGPRPPRMGLRLDGSRFKRGDANRDGFLSSQEATVMGLYYFDAMDRDRNGQVTVAEREAFRSARASKATGR